MHTLYSNVILHMLVDKLTPYRTSMQIRCKSELEHAHTVDGGDPFCPPQETWNVSIPPTEMLWIQMSWCEKQTEFASIRSMSKDYLSLPAGSLRASMRDEVNLFDPLSSRPAVGKNCSEGKAFESVVQGTVFFGVLFIGYVYKNRWFYLADGIKPKVLSPWNASISNQTNLTRTPIVLYRLPRSCARPQPQLSCSQFPF